LSLAERDADLALARAGPKDPLEALSALDRHDDLGALEARNTRSEGGGRRRDQ
jgi:hypothetical protein